MSTNTHPAVPPRPSARAGGPRDPRPAGRPSLRTEQQSDRVKLRRALTFVGMSLVLPGSAQLAAGNRRVGRIALRIWVGLWAAALVAVLLAVFWRGAVITLAASPVSLRIGQVLLVVLGVGWLGVIIDAWRLARPPELARGHRLGFTLLNLVLVLGISGSLVAGASMINSQRELMASVFSGGGDSAAKNGRINVLLMGGDAGSDRVGLRPDSMTVASIDAVTGRTVLFSLPRNLMHAPFPASSPLHKVFPTGFRCPDGSCMLNAVYTYAMAHRDLYPGVTDPGATATVEAAEGVTGLDINYYALIDLKGFQKLIDAVGGITITVNTRLPIGGQVPGQKVAHYIEPGTQHLDGYHALWFARSRHADSDYARMERQKCVMNAMLNQLDPVTVVTKFNAIASAGKQIVATDVPPSEINTMMGLALKAKKKPITSLALVPPAINPADPDFTQIHSLVAARIAKAEAADAPHHSATAKPKASSSGGSGASSSPAATSPSRTSSSAGANPAQDTDNLAAVCSA